MFNIHNQENYYSVLNYQIEDNINNELFVALDLDQTLISTFNFRKNVKDIEFQLYDNNFFLSKRPYLEFFLNELSNFAKIYLFTSSESFYANSILKIIDPTGYIFSGFFYRDSCIKQSDFLFKKDVQVLGTPLSRTILIDDDENSMLKRENGILIRKYKGQSYYKELLSTLKYLKILNNYSDIKK